INVKPKRGTLSETYEQIIDDLTESIDLLPEKGERKSRPSKVAAYAMLARVYLVMGEYDKALKASSLALTIQDALMDYNHLDSNAVTPFVAGRNSYNEEIIYYTNQIPVSIFNLPLVSVNNELIKLYHNNDLRRKIFYDKEGGFKGS